MEAKDLENRFKYHEADLIKVVKAEGEDALQKKMKELEELFPQHGGWFSEGEVVQLKGSTFRVKRIKPNEITLKLMKRGEQ
jgi:hypothetical protein